MKLGIFGGTFNPIHAEHINIIKHCLRGSVDKVLIVPTFKPWHKDIDILDYEHRKRIIDLSIEGIENCEVDEIEKENNLVNSYSYYVLSELKKKYPNDTLYFILGGDSLFNITKWKNFEEVLRGTPIIAIERKGYEDFSLDIEKYKKLYGANITISDYVGEQISSSLIQTKLELNYGVEGLVNENALLYIKEYKLYNKYAFYLEKLKSELSERTYKHSLRTVLFTIPFASRLYLSYDEVFISALLHDNAKEKYEEFFEYPDENKNVIHQFLGAKRAKVCYNVDNENIINAIMYHTTGKANMTTLQKLIYSGDMLEENRDFEGVELLRQAINNNFEKGFLLCLERTYLHLIAKNSTIDNLTAEAYGYYIQKN